jgi:hypothetical protein
MSFFHFHPGAGIVFGKIRYSIGLPKRKEKKRKEKKREKKGSQSKQVDISLKVIHIMRKR